MTTTMKLTICTEEASTYVMSVIVKYLCKFLTQFRWPSVLLVVIVEGTLDMIVNQFHFSPDVSHILILTIGVCFFLFTNTYFIPQWIVIDDQIRKQVYLFIHNMRRRHSKIMKPPGDICT
eukprot:415619_1